MDCDECVTPAEAGFDVDRLQRARDLCRAATEAGDVPAIALTVARGGRLVIDEAWGFPAGAGTAPATPDTVWLIASITKPVVCAGVCLLLERGLLALDDPVSRYLPAYSGDDRRATTLRHLLTHSSGLPDMLPENVELRQRHAPLSEFVERICTTPLLFPPGTGVSYQSAGIALLGAVIERVAGVSCPDFLRREFFQPLGMQHCSLGWRPELEERLAPAGPTSHAAAVPTDWDWNSPYWRQFAAPWGGMYASTREFLTFMQMLLTGGVSNGRRILGATTVAEMTRNQTADLPDLSSAARRRSTWGLGWRHAAGRESEYMGDLVGPRAYGHAGATGTGTWNDPDTGVTFIYFSNRPDTGRFIGLVSNAVAAAIL